MAGGIAALGSEVTTWRAGDQVCALVPGGGYAEYCRTDASHCLPVPRGLNLEMAAAIPETFFTVWTNLVVRGRLQADWMPIMLRRLTVTGSTLRARSVQEKAAIAEGLHVRVWPMLESGQVKVVIYRTFPFSEFVEAHRLMESGEHTGKIVLELR